MAEYLSAEPFAPCAPSPRQGTGIPAGEVFRRGRPTVPTFVIIIGERITSGKSRPLVPEKFLLPRGLRGKRNSNLLPFLTFLLDLSSLSV